MAEPLKDQFFHPDFIQSLSAAIAEAHAKFDAAAFRTAVLDGEWPARELKQRMRHISTMLHAHLPVAYPRQIRILEKIAPRFPGFPAMIFPDFVEQFGIGHFDISVRALERFTPLCSSEFAVRPFLIHHESPMLARMMEWTRHSDHHVRRLASEGCRPRLPWAMALPRFKKDPAPILPILEALKNDPSEYVRRSVANNLNDIAKDNPRVTLAIATRWLGASAETDAIVKHACRTLLKAGDREALALFGFRKHANAEIARLRSDRKKLAIGQTLAFSFDLHNPAAGPATLRLEYTVYFARPNGRQGKKIFQIVERDFPPGVTRIQRRHSFEDRSIRKHHPGEHTLAISVNGVEKARIRFLLREA
jgi:3-methyladenine DNA glycosylase AlkC